jgi:hypothetical protein
MNVKKVCTPRPAGANPTERSLVYIRYFLVTIKPVIFAVFITSKSKYFWVGGGAGGDLILQCLKDYLNWGSALVQNLLLMYCSLSSLILFIKCIVHRHLTGVKSGTVESLQSYCIHTQFHWSSGPPICFPS